MLRQFQTALAINTTGRGLVEITRPVADWTAGTSIESGLLTLFIRHTSASLVVQENADPDVRGDLERLLRSSRARWRSSSSAIVDEGSDDMPAHVRAALTATFSCRFPIVAGAASCSVRGKASTCSNTVCDPIGAR